MLNRIFTFSLGNRFLILVFTFLIVGVGIFSLRLLPIDAVPDITTVQVQILTRTAPLGPVEVERYVTFPVEAAMSGLPDVEEIRSLSRFGALRRDGGLQGPRQRLSRPAALLRAPSGRPGTE